MPKGFEGDEPIVVVIRAIGTDKATVCHSDTCIWYVKSKNQTLIGTLIVTIYI